MQEEIRLNDARALRIRYALASDTQLFMSFFEGLSVASRDFMHGWSVDTSCTREHADRLAKKADAEDHCCLVVLDGTAPHERIVGYSWIQGIGVDDIPMLGIGVIDEYHGVGMGTTIMRRMIDEARNRRGARDAWCFRRQPARYPCVRVSRIPARSCLPRSGFRRTERTLHGRRDL